MNFGLSTYRCKRLLLLLILIVSPLSILSAAPADIILTISPDQVIGQPLIGNAQIVLLDGTGTIISNFDIASNPITLISDTGSLTPLIVDDSSLFVNGIIDLSALAVIYTGPSGAVRVKAKLGAVESSDVILTYNGLDIKSVTTSEGQAFSDIYSDLLTDILVEVQSGGDIASVGNPQFRVHFQSGGGSLSRNITPIPAPGRDTLSVELPNHNLPAGANALILEVSSSYDVGGNIYVTADTSIIAINVLVPQMLQFVDGSMTPDSIYAGSSFDLSFVCLAPGAISPIDSSSVKIRLYTDTILDPVALLFDGSPATITPIGGNEIQSIVSLNIDTAISSGWYHVRLDHSIASSGQIYVNDTRFPDSIYLIAPSPISYVAASFSPDTVNAGDAIQFAFEIELAAGPSPEIILSSPEISVTSDNFAATAPLTVASGTIVSGVNRFLSDPLLIPSSQVGKSLTVDLSIPYRVTGSGNYTIFTSDLNGTTFFAQDPPHIKIVSLVVDAPNIFAVNTNQNFRMLCRVANLSTEVTGPVYLGLSSDGQSLFNPDVTIASILSGDTASVYFDVVASSSASASDVFQVNIDSGSVVEETPLDNVAALQITTPASLTFSRQPSSDTIIVETGENITLTYEVDNSGGALVSQAVFSLSGGSAFGIADPVVDSIASGTPYSIDLIAPEVDSETTMIFTITRQPVDINDTSEATLTPSTFSITILTRSVVAGLFVSASPAASSLILPGAKNDLINVTFSYGGSTLGHDISIDSLYFHMVDRSMLPLPASEFFVSGTATMIDSDDIYLQSGKYPGVLWFEFDQLILSESNSERTLLLSAKAQATNTRPFGMELATHVIYASIASGPQAGTPVDVTAESGAPYAINHFFTPVSALSLKGSFVIRDNPFDPTQGPAEMQFFLSEPSPVSFRILTLTGQEVYSRDFTNGDLVVGSLNTVNWDGRNENGDIVLDGVYIAWIRVEDSGEEQIIKIAVVK